MPKIIFLAHDHDFKLGLQSGIINGATSTIFHYQEAFKKLGWEAEMQECSIEHPLLDGDVYFCQSEWFGAREQEFKELRKKGKKLICWLGHWIGGVYFDPKLIEADLFITTWKGEVVKKYEEATGKKVHYIPHAFGEDDGGGIVLGGIVFAGNTYSLRSEDILEGIQIVRISGVHPAGMPRFYKGAKFCLNFHGPFQCGEISNDTSSLANDRGFALNERTFQTSGAGGFQMCQEHPLLKTIFPNNEIVTFTDNQDLKEKIAYWIPREQERKEMAAKAREVILKDHTYLHRCKTLIYLLNQ